MRKVVEASELCVVFVSAYAETTHFEGTDGLPTFTGKNEVKYI